MMKMMLMMTATHELWRQIASHKRIDTDMLRTPLAASSISINRSPVDLTWRRRQLIISVIAVDRADRHPAIARYDSIANIMTACTTTQLDVHAEPT